MASPFEPIEIGGMRIRNRFMRSATWDSSATDDGEVTADSVRIISDLAKGGIGLISTGHAYVIEIGKASRRQLAVSEDRHVPGLRRLAEAAHEHGAKIALQIAHGGINLRLLGHTDRVALAPSALEGNFGAHRAMTVEEIRKVIDAFAAAAVRAREAGFDGVQLHGAHGYLLSQFLSPKMNHRTDEWGGSPENRRRIHIETMKAVRKAVGAEYPVLIKMGLRDQGEGGLPLDEGLAALQALAAEGLTAVETSGGAGGSASQADKPGDVERTYYREDASAAKRGVSIPVMLVGGIRSLSLVQGVLDAGDADMISMSRPFIREPGLIARWSSGDASPAKCISCNKCFSFGIRGEVLECGEEKRIREEAAAAAHQA